MMPCWTSIWPVLLVAVNRVTGFEYKRVCYYNNQAQSRPGAGMCAPESIDPTLCTHLIYAYATMVDNKLKASLATDETTLDKQGMYERFNELRKKNPFVKTMLSVGGWDFGTAKMSTMLASRAKRDKFVRTSVQFLRKRKFDGIDLDFEYPGNRGSPAVDKHRFTLLCKEFRVAFDRETKMSGRSRLLLSVVVSAIKSVIDKAYEVEEMTRYVDFINLKAFNFHESSEGTTGIDAPLHHRATEPTGDQRRNVAWAANYWAKKRCPRRKIIVGMALYGHSFTLAADDAHGLGSSTTGGGKPGLFTNEAGLYSFYEICKSFLYHGGTMVWHKEHKAPYIFSGDTWIGYDDRYSLKLKVQWMKRGRFGGWMAWSIDLDDFSGSFCNQNRFPLLTALNKATRKPIRRTSAKGENAGFETGSGMNADPTRTLCMQKADGFYASADSCSRFFRCVNRVSFTFFCPMNLVFDRVNTVCNFADKVDQDDLRRCGYRGNISTNPNRNSGDANTSGSPLDTGNSASNPLDTGNAAGNPLDTPNPAGNPLDTGNASGNPLDTPNPAGNPLDTGDSAGNPLDTGDSAGNPGDTGESAGAPLDTGNPASSPYNTVVTETPIEKHDSRGNPCGGKANGLYPNPDNCIVFYRCIHEKSTEFHCPHPYLYDPDVTVCNEQAKIKAEHLTKCRHSTTPRKP